MHTYTRILTTLTVLGVLLSACGGNASNSERKTVVVTPAIKGNSASLSVGDILEIQMPTIPTEGFEWQTQDLDTTILTQEGEAVYTADTSPNSAGGMVTLRFNAVGAGETVIKLFYVNSPSTGIPSLYSNSFSMKVVVK
jgi:predicted secreted protein